MFQPIRVLTGSLPERIRTGLGRRAVGIGAALLAEVLLLLMLLTLGASITQDEHKEADMTVVSFQKSRDPEPTPEPPESSAQDTPREKKPVPPPPQPAAEVRPQPVKPDLVQPTPLLQLSPKEMASADISAKPQKTPAKPSQQVMGPPDTGTPGDTPRVGGTGPNGEPLYAAAWYREPYDDELNGYLSTATGPGWGLIACRTVPDFRVENCVAVGESPPGSNIARAVLAAAWQFRVRPPRVGGRLMVGEWVRIRIDYGLKRR